MLADLVDEWDLEIGGPIEPGGVTALVVPARKASGDRCVLKLAVPSREVAAEAAALDYVGGDGAVRLYRHDPTRWALLLEAVDESRSLRDLPDTEAAVDLAADLMRRWWRPVERDIPIPPLESVTVHDARKLAASSRRLSTEVSPAALDRAVAWLNGPWQGPPVLLHTDLHLGNVLAAEREPWLIIDPQPCTGPAEYDLEPLLRDDDLASGDDDVALRRFDRLTERLDLDRVAAREALLARALVVGLWAMDHGASELARRHIRRCLAIADRC